MKGLEILNTFIDRDETQENRVENWVDDVEMHHYLEWQNWWRGLNSYKEGKGCD